jgi:hypothetical protein
MEALVKIGDFINFVVITSTDKDVSLNFSVYEINSWHGDDDTPLYDDMELYLTGQIKWDGCSNLYFGEGGHMHLCGKFYFESLKKVLDALWIKAEEEVVKFDKEVAS